MAQYSFFVLKVPLNTNQRTASLPFCRLRENNYHHETLGIDCQWFWDQAIKFATWQHPAMEFAVPGTSCCYLLVDM